MTSAIIAVLEFYVIRQYGGKSLFPFLGKMLIQQTQNKLHV